MQILQNDIFGTKHNTLQEKEKKQSLAAASKTFKEVTLLDGINEINATNEAMLIHRVLQKKILYAGLSTQKQKEIFLRILENEMKIKSGQIEAVTATRDSLLAFFGR